MIGGVIIPILTLALPVLKDVIGIDISIHQFMALPPSPAAIATASPPAVPFCRPMLRTMTEDDLNRIEVVRVTGNCR